MRIGQSDWCVESLDWAIEQSPECVSLVSPNEIGSFQISCYRKRNGVVDDADVAHFRAEAASQAPGTESSLSTFGEFAGLAVTHELDDTYWRRWWLWHGAINLFVTYDCEVAARGREDAIVDQLVASFRARTA
jgi:hypothetical protein